MKRRFWTVIAILRMLPRMSRLCGRLVLWGARSGEEIDRMLETSLFKTEWDAIHADTEEYIRARLA